jgi:hypothetical protein
MTRRAALLQPGHGGVFMNPHAQLQRHPAQATHQFARLHAGGGRREPAFQCLEPAMRCTSASGRWVNELMPLRSSAAITASVEPTCARLVAV